MATDVGSGTTSTGGASGYQPPAGSLEEAQSRLVGLLSDSGDPPAEDGQTESSQPEQTPRPSSQDDTAAAASEQAPAAPEATDQSATEESEQATQVRQAETEGEASAPRLFTVQVDGKKVEVTEQELLRSYAFEAYNNKRAADNNRQHQELLDEKARFHQQLEDIRVERQNLQTELERAREAVKAFTPSEPDWELRRFQVPAEQLAQEIADWQRNQKVLKGLEARRAELQAKADADKAQTDAEQQATLQAALAEEHRRLQAAIPDFADPGKGAKLRQDIIDYGVSMGIPEDVLADVRDHRYVLLLHKAMQYDKAQQAKPKIANKIEQTLTTAAPGNRNPAPKPSKLDQAKSRLQRSGRIEDAAAALMEII